MPPKLPRKADLRELNDFLGDIASKLDKIASFKDAFSIDSGPLDDAASKLDKIGQLNEGWAKSLEKVSKRSEDLQKKLKDAEKRQRGAQEDRNKAFGKYEDAMKRSLDRNKKNLADLDRTGKALKDAQKELDKYGDRVSGINRELRKMPGTWGSIAKLVGGTIAGGFDKLGKAIIDVGLATFTESLTLLQLNMTDIYELHERWTKAIGQFRTQMGAAGSTVDDFTRIATGMEGTLRTLTGEFGASFKEMGAFIEGFGFADDRAKALAKDTILAGRALGIGSEGAAGLSRTLTLMGMGAQEVARYLKFDVAEAADRAGVSTAQLGKDLVDNREFAAEFGKASQKAFLNAASFVKRLGMSLRTLHEFTRLTDTFDSAAEASAKLNTAFGTSINALDLILEQDPARRFEMVRQQLKGQGKDLSNLSRQEKILIGDTLKISQEELNAVIDSNLTYDEFLKKQEQKKRTEQEFQRMLMKTKETLVSFQLQWDRVTRSIEHLVRPLTDMLGLTKSGEKGAASFGQVMNNVFGKLAEFIDQVARNPAWQRFMKGVARDIGDLFARASAFARSPEFGSWLDGIVKGAHDFYDIMKLALGAIVDLGRMAMPIVKFIAEHLKEILAIWLGGKMLGFAAGQIGGANALFQLLGGLRGGGGGGAAAGGLGLGALGGTALGTAAGAFGTGGTKAGFIGGGIGGAAASIAAAFIPVVGPFLAPFAGMLGGYLGGKIGAHFFGEGGKLADSAKTLAEQLDAAAAAAARAAEADATRAGMEKEAQAAFRKLMETGGGKLFQQGVEGAETPLSVPWFDRFANSLVALNRMVEAPMRAVIPAPATELGPMPAGLGQMISDVAGGPRSSRSPTNFAANRSVAAPPRDVIINVNLSMDSKTVARQVVRTSLEDR